MGNVLPQPRHLRATLRHLLQSSNSSPHCLHFKPVVFLGLLKKYMSCPFSRLAGSDLSFKFGDIIRGFHVKKPCICCVYTIFGEIGENLLGAEFHKVSHSV